MEKQQLTQTLESLHRELAATEKLDEETRALLTKLADDIERLAEKEEAEPLGDQLQDFVQQFGADHPQLARAVNQVASALANLGI